MFRLFFLMIGIIFAFMLWRIIRIVMRGGGTGGLDDRTAGGGRKPEEPDRAFRNAKDAEFEDLKPPPEEGKPGGKP